MTRPTVRVLALAALVLLLPAAATAQVIGTFSWQTQPYCNLLTVTVVQQGGVYLLTGTDNLCGAGSAPVTGTAAPSGANVVFGVTVALPSGRAGHVSAIIDLGTLSGTWSDADGNAGPFVFGAAGAGAPRPAPAPTTAIGVAQLAPSVYAGSGSAVTVARSDHTHDERYFTKAETTALLATKSAPLEVIVTAGASAVTPDSIVSALRSATTTRAGRLDVSMVFGFNVTCSAGSAYAYLTVDGAVLLSSMSPLPAGFAIMALRGVTAAAVAPGQHDIGVAINCPAGTPTSVISSPGAATVIVIP